MVRPPMCAAMILIGSCGSPSDQCGQPVTCSHGSVQSCVSADHAHCLFRTSDGTTIDCVACADCAAASQRAASWCMGGSGGGGTGSGGAGDGDGGTTGRTGGNGLVAQSPECKQLLQCVSVVAPSQFPPLVNVYGPSGSCWSDASVAASCTQACIHGLADYAKSTGAPECGGKGDMAMPPPPDMSCFPALYDCGGDPACCGHCCSAGCSLVGFCASS